MEKNIDWMGILIFDLDGTLVDSMPGHASAFSGVLHDKFGVDKQFSIKEYMDSAGLPLNQQFKQTLSLAGIETNDTDEMVVAFWEHLEHIDVKAFPYTLEIISILHSAGYKLVVSSGSSPEVVCEKLKKAGLYKYIALNLGTDYKHSLITKGKEHIEIIKKTFKLSSEQFQTNALMIGDGTHDMKIAKQANIASIGVVTDNNETSLISAGADTLIYSIAELVSILCRKGDFRPVNNIIEQSERNLTKRIT